MALGETLRKARMARKETASQVASATRMKVQIVEGLEKGDYSQIPAPIYAKGFIKLYAEHVGLDPDPLIREYLQNRTAPTPSPVVTQKPKRGKSTRQPEDKEPPSDLFKRAGIALPGDVAPPEPERETVEPQNTAWRDPDKSVLNSDLERYHGSRNSEPADMETEDPPITLLQQFLEKSLLALQHGVERLGTAQGKLRETLQDVSINSLWQTPVKHIAAAAALIVILILLLSGLSRLFKGDQAADPVPAPDPVLMLLEDAPEPYFD